MLIENINELKGYLKNEVSKAFAEHSLTNKLTQTLRFETEANEKEVELRMFAKTYGIFLDKGVKAEDIPFSRGSGAGKSKYIEGLTRYGNLRLGLTGRNALSFAFAVATKQKKVGMPIKTRGQGSKWFTNMVKDLNLSNKIEKILKNEVAVEIRNAIKKT